MLTGACRIALLFYAVWLVYQHPIANFQNNVHVLIDSIVCVEQTVIRLIRESIKSAVSPLRSNLFRFLNVKWNKLIIVLYCAPSCIYDLVEGFT